MGRRISVAVELVRAFEIEKYFPNISFQFASYRNAVTECTTSNLTDV